MTIIDGATRITHLIASSKSLTAPQFAGLYMREVARLHGIPSILYSDRGTQFTSNLGKNCGNYLGRSSGLAPHIIHTRREYWNG